MEEQKLIQIISPFVPSESVDIVVSWIADHKIFLTITEKRDSVLGDYHRPLGKRGHRISVNGDLNRYAFLVTFVHEMAHLETWLKYHDRASAHGKEWKKEFKFLMDEFTGRRIFPGDIRTALKKYLVNPLATHCDDPELMKVLNRYNSKKTLHLEDLEYNDFFLWTDGKVFRKGDRLRKRFVCFEVKTNRIYYFNPATEVQKVKFER